MYTNSYLIIYTNIPIHISYIYIHISCILIYISSYTPIHISCIPINISYISIHISCIPIFNHVSSLRYDSGQSQSGKYSNILTLIIFKYYDLVPIREHI